MPVQEDNEGVQKGVEEMRNFKTFSFEDEMPPHMGRQIEIPEFMLAEKPKERKVSILPDVVRFASLSGIVYFFCLTELHLIAGLLGMAASITVLAFTGGAE